MYKERDLVISELRELFDTENNLDKGTSEGDGKFYINKQHIERLQVIDMLQSYFDGVGVKDGYIKVSPITMVFTSFEVCKGVPS